METAQNEILILRAGKSVSIFSSYVIRSMKMLNAMGISNFGEKKTGGWKVLADFT